MALFKIASGYVEVKGVVDRVSVRQAADRFTRDVADQMDTGTAFANSREGGRTLGAIYGEHAAPTAAIGLSEGIFEWFSRGGGTGGASEAGGALGEHIGQGASATLPGRLGESVHEWAGSESTHEAGRTLGKTLGEHVTEALTEASSTFIDKNGRERDRETGRFTPGNGSSSSSNHNSSSSSGDNGRRDGDRYGRSFLERVESLIGGGLGSAVSAASTLAAPILGTVGAAAGAIIAIPLMAAIGAAVSASLIAVTGLGLIGLGAYLLKGNERVAAAGTSLKEKLASTFTDAAEPLIEPFINGMGILEDLIETIGPDLREMFEALAPAIEPLAKGFAGFVENLMPGFIALAEAAAPFLEDMALWLPRLGEDLGFFFEIIGSEGDGATDFFRDFFNLLGIGIIILGATIGFLTDIYGRLHDIFSGLKNANDDLVDSVFGLGERVKQIFGGLRDFVGGIWDGIRRDPEGALNFFRSIPGQVDDALNGIPGRIFRIFSGAGSWLWNAGKAIIRSLIDGIRDMIPELTDLLGWVTDKIPDWKGPAERDKDILRPAGRSVMDSFTDGLQDRVDNVRSTLGDVTGSLPSMVPNRAVVGGGNTYNITVNLSSVLDDPTLPRVVAGRIFEAIKRYEKDYA